MSREVAHSRQLPASLRRQDRGLMAMGRRSLGFLLIVLGIAVDVLGVFAFPSGSTVCNDGECATTFAPIAYYAVEVVGAAVFILGFVLVYAAARSKSETMAP